MKTLSIMRVLWSQALPRLASLCLASLCLATACDQPMPDPSPGTLDAPALQAAHNAWLEGDLPALVKHTHTVLTDDTLAQPVHQNALALLDHAWRHNKGRLPSDWQPPEALTQVNLKYLRVQTPDRVYFRLLVTARADPYRIPTIKPNYVVSRHLMALPADLRHFIKQIELIGADGQTVFNRKGLRGGLIAEIDPDYHIHWEAEGDEMATPPPEGLYRIRFTLYDGQVTEVWCPLVSAMASASPTVLTPAVDEVIRTPTPTVEWTDFTSPEYTPGEGRGVGIQVLKLFRLEQIRRRPLWSFWRASPDFTHVQIKPSSKPGEGLKPGQYWIGVTFNEIRHFGKLRLIRAARTARTFSVSSEALQPVDDLQQEGTE